MPIKINSYPTLNDNLIKNCNIKINSFDFYNKNQLLKYSKFGDRKGIKIESDSRNWNKESDGLSIKVCYSIEHPNLLFGPDGIACDDALLGIALSYRSQQSKLRGSIKSKNFICNQKDKLEIYLEYDFPPAMLRGEVDFESFLFIEKESINTPNQNTVYLANSKGLLLGSLNDCFYLSVDGTGSIFPIYLIKKENEPLWKIVNKCYDIKSDLFNQTISFEINELHDSYNLFRSDPNFMIEVLTSAFVTLISDLRYQFNDEWSDVINNTDLVRGSVGDVLYSFSNRLGWTYSSMADLSTYIKKNTFKVSYIRSLIHE